MQRKLKFVCGAGLTSLCAVLFLGAPAHAADPNGTGRDTSADRGANVAPNSDQSASLQLPNGIERSQKQTEAKDVAKPVADVTEDAFTKDHFDNIVKNFVAQDRDRMSDSKKLDDDAFNSRADQLSKAWNDKYNQKFSIDRDKVFANAQAVEGEIKDPQALANSWPVPASAAAGSSAQPAAAASGNNPNPNASANAHANANDKDMDNDKDNSRADMTKDRNVAILRLPAEQGLPAVDVSLVHEITGWKIDVPNNRTAQQIHDDLIKQLSALSDKSNQLPSNVDDAYRVAAHRVIMAIYGVEAPMGQGG